MHRGEIFTQALLMLLKSTGILCVYTSMQKLCVGSFPVYSYTVESMQILQARTRHLSYLSADLDSGNVCPACPKVLIKG